MKQPRQKTVVSARELPRLADTVAAQIEREIARRHWKAGALLGTEAELMERYGVSRETLRKAIRQIERHGAAVMRRGGGGGGGGLVVTQAAPAAAVRAIAGYLELSDVGWPEILEARGLIDLHAVQLATSRIDESGIDRLRGLAARLDQGSIDARDIARRHMALPAAIAELSGNPALALFAEALNSFTLDILPAALGSPQARVAQARRTNALLRALVEAIVAGDAAAAQQAAREFGDNGVRLAATLERVRHAALPELDLPDAAHDSATRAEARPDDGRNKRPQRLALRLARAIALQGWQVGELLGAEPDLVARHGVSRAVMREAVQLLELHGVARSRRGRGGGLRIGRPDPSYAIASAARYLRQAGLGAEACREVRRALLLGAAQLAAQRATDSGLARLEELVRSAAPAEQAGAAAVQDFHRALCELSGNRALALLTQIVLSMAADGERTNERAVPHETEVKTRLAHLLEALLAHDAARARRQMLEHLAETDGLLHRAMA
jgi:DNA-binding FadR family transcriptional regulator